jgi:hypothetical protein
MPVAIILAASEEAKARAARLGYREATVMLKDVATADEARTNLELSNEVRPYQFIVTTYWGARPD